MSYIIITPVYNEERYLSKYINSIVNQTLLPHELIIVDDNSSDDSSSIIKSFSEKHCWIKYKYHKSEDKKIQGSKVIKAFNFGIKNVNLERFKFIAKIDADLELPENYFENINLNFDNNKSNGIVGGYILECENNVWTPKYDSAYHIRGALKSYRTECFKEIDGLMPVLGWDGLDEMKAFYKGWLTENLDLPVKHFRPAASDYKPLSLTYKVGEANYKNGGSFFLAIIRSIVRLKDKPYIINGISFFVGYTISAIRKDEKNVDKSLSNFINKFHRNRMKKVNKL